MEDGLRHHQRMQRAVSELPVLGRYLALVDRPDTPDLNRLRLRGWINAALATLDAKTPTEEVCLEWSAATDEILRSAWARFPELQTCLLFALGKLGAQELNLSSDIDLVAVAPDGMPPPLQAFREFISLISTHSSAGFLYRVDLNLRPGGRHSPLLPTATEFVNHFLAHGQAWERLAWIRAREVCRPSEGIAEISDFLSRYVFRRHLDFTVVEDLKAIRGLNRAELKPEPPGLINIKLGVGGIREIETYVHSLAAIHGGRRPSLRTHRTSDLIRALANEGLISAEEASEINHCYWTFRHHENLAQAREDLQTYLIPDSQEMRDLCASVDRITSQFFVDRSQTALTLPSLADLGQRGFDVTSIGDSWSELESGRVRSRQADRDESARRTFIGSFVSSVERRGVDRTLAIHLLADFERAVRAKATLFELMNRNPPLIDSLADIFSTSPFLGGLIVRRPELLDGWLLRRDDPFSGPLDELIAQMIDRRLLVELLAAADLLQSQNLDRLQENLTLCADQICMALLTEVLKGSPGLELAVLALGKWGSGELGLQSDLDFIFVTRQSLSEAHHRACRRLLSLLGTPHSGGRLYSFDMRLRPSGHAGPLLVRVEELREFLGTKAEAWQRQAYLRARWIDPSKTYSTTKFFLPPVRENEQKHLQSIRSQLIQDAKGSGVIDVKSSSGGLIDCEFTAQVAFLDQGREVPCAGAPYARLLEWLSEESEAWRLARPRLLAGYARLRRFEQTYHLVCETGGTKIRTVGGEWDRLRRVMGTEGADLLGLIGDELNALATLNESLRRTK